jgi:hypothetical protein
MMSRKDYISVADILHENKNRIDSDVFHDLVIDFSDFFFKDNPNFSPTRFELACWGNDEMADVK